MSVDSRIVTMKFDNAQFEQSASTTMSTLGKLKASLDFSSATSAVNKSLSSISGVLSKFGVHNPFASTAAGVSDLQARTNTFSMAPIEGAVTSVSASFIAMSTVAITALSSIVSKAIDSGLQITKSLTIGPIGDGFSDYTAKLTSVQTVMNATGESMAVVGAHFNELDEYADKTVFNLSDMTGAFAKFTNAGVKMDVSIPVIKGIANMVALAGQGAGAASVAMYNLSQSIGGGFLTTTDFRSLNLANVATIEWKDNMVKGAVAAGTLKKNADGMYTILADGSGKVVTKQALFNDELSRGWASTKVLTDVLGEYGDTTTDIGKKAQSAAQDVKDLPMMMDTLKASVGTGWTDTFEIVLGNVKESKKLFSGLTETVGGMLSSISDHRNKVLGNWKDMGGRTLLLDSLKTAFEGVMTVFKPIQEAFREIFPAKTAKDLLGMTESFAKFADSLKIGKDTAEDVKRTFKGVFAIFSIAGLIISGIVDGFQTLFGVIGDGSGGFLDFTGGIGDFLVALNEMLEKSGIISAFFEGLGEVLTIPLKLLAGVGGLFVGLFTGFDSSGAEKVSDAFGQINDRIQPLKAAGDRIREIFSGIGDVLSKVGGVIGDALSGIGDVIAGAFTPAAFSKTLDVINTGLLAGIVLLLKNFFSKGMKLDFTGGLFDGVKDTLGSVTDAMNNMQTQIKADIILKIAAALAILTASIVVLSLIDPKKLAKALTGMAVGFAGMQIALVSLSNAIGYIGLAKLPIIAGALIGLATALLILSTALLILSRIDLGDMVKGLFGMGAMLFILSKAVVPLSKNAGGMIRAAAALVILGVALNIMAIALKVFASMSWEEMARGLSGVAGMLTVLVVAMRLMPKGMVLQATAILVLSVALNALAVALKIFNTMSWDEMAHGLVALGGALAIIAAAMYLMPKDMILQAVALNFVAAALVVLSGALKSMGGMTWEEIGKGLVTLGGALVILAAGLYLMSGTLGGAAALVVATAALTVLVPILITLGNLEWETIIKGLTALAGIFAVLGLAGLILAPVLPVIAGLAISLLVIGAGLALIGVGALAAATAFALVVASGMAGVEILAAILGTFISSIPEALKAFGQGIIEFAKAIAKGGPEFFEAFSAIISSMLDAVIKNVPKMGKAFRTMLDEALKTIDEMAPRIFDSGLKLIIGFLEAIDKHIPKISDLAASIIVKFLDGISRNIGKIIDSGFKLIIKFIEGLTDAINENQEQLTDAGLDLAEALISGMVNGLQAGAGRIKDAALAAAKEAWEAVKDFWKVNSPSKKFQELSEYAGDGMALGFITSSGRVAKSAETLAAVALDTITHSLSGISQAISDNIDINPTITPVLDLSVLQREATRINGIVNPMTMVGGTNLRQATAIAESEKQYDEDGSLIQPERSLEFHQYNYSPKAISAIDTYRQTRNQLSLAKEELGL